MRISCSMCFRYSMCYMVEVLQCQYVFLIWAVLDIPHSLAWFKTTVCLLDQFYAATLTFTYLEGIVEDNFIGGVLQQASLAYPSRLTIITTPLALSAYLPICELHSKFVQTRNQGGKEVNMLHTFIFKACPRHRPFMAYIRTSLMMIYFWM